MITPLGRGVGYLDTIWEAGKHFRGKGLTQGEEVAGSQFPSRGQESSQGQVHPPVQMETWGRGTWGLMGLLENSHCRVGAKSG